jgi:heme oxygenase (biliverdin-IX-beta and delta-forming)
MRILSALKEGTWPQHEKLEKELNLLRPDLTLDDYVELLKRFYGLYKPLEEAIEIPQTRVKTAHLEADLRHFNVDPQSIELSHNLPDIKTKSQYYGLRYVLEGSTLGGLVLTKHFKEVFHISPDSGCFFFSGYGKDTMMMWKQFQEELVRFSESENYDEQDLIKSAQDTFECLRLWLISKK